jgi:hypothetical protein
LNLAHVKVLLSNSNSNLSYACRFHFCFCAAAAAPGNIFLQPQCGVLFIDWTSGDTLQITGTASIDFNSHSMPGAEHVVVLSLAEWVFTPAALPLAAPAPVLEPSPYNPRLLQEGPAQLQELECVSVVDAAVGIKSFEVEAPAAWMEAAAAGQAPYQPGQYASFDFDLGCSTYNRTCERNWGIALK